MPGLEGEVGPGAKDQTWSLLGKNMKERREDLEEEKADNEMHDRGVTVKKDLDEAKADQEIQADQGQCHGADNPHQVHPVRADGTDVPVRADDRGVNVEKDVDEGKTDQEIQAEKGLCHGADNPHPVPIVGADEADDQEIEQGCG